LSCISQVFGYELGSPGFSAAPAPLVDIQQPLNPTSLSRSFLSRVNTTGNAALESSAQHSTARLQPGLIWQAASSCRSWDNKVVVCSTDGTLRLLQVQQQQQQQQLQPVHASSCAVNQEQDGDETTSDGGLNSEGVDRGGGMGHAVLQQQQQQQAVVLPGEVFSSPVVLGPWVVVGCRDDNLYCMLR
jgi:hypothetical protein